jgi:hypothetical protein
VNEQNTDLWQQRLGEDLNALADLAAPVATVSVGDVVGSGRRARRRRRHRSAVALSAVLVLVAALTVGALAMAHHDGALAPPAGNVPSPGGSASSGKDSDPAQAGLAFGWLPSSMNGTNEIEQFAAGTNFMAGANSHTALLPMDGPGGTFLQAWQSGAVSLTASITGPGSGIPQGQSLSSAGTVDGHQAWWADGAPGSQQATSGGALTLYWQYEPNALATITYHGTPDAAAGIMLLHVANTLVIGPTKSYALPFHLPSAPSGMHAYSFNLNLPSRENSQFGGGSLILCLKNPCNSFGTVASGTPGGLFISQQPTTWDGGEQTDLNDAPMLVPGTDSPIQAPGATAAPSHQSVTVDGHPATLWTETSGATLTFNYDGTTALVSAADAEYQALGGATGFLSFCQSLTWYGPNPAHWTTDVIG